MKRIEHFCMKAPQKSVMPSEIRYPCIVQDKYDGIRALNHPRHGWITARGKQIPNRWIRAQLKKVEPNYDGELVIPGQDFNTIQSVVMSHEHPMEKDVIYVVFDYLGVTRFEVRRPDIIASIVHSSCDLPIWCALVRATCHNEAAFIQFVEGYQPQLQQQEGLMIRWLYSPYKFGRCTVKEGYLLKYVEFLRDEAVVVDWVAESQSKHAAGTVSIGALVVEHKKFGRFEVGSGFSEQQRLEPYTNFIGKTVTFKYKPFGMKDKPRAPIFVGVRYD